MVKRKQAPPRLCYFCGRPGSRSKEHVWPPWMHSEVKAELPAERWHYTTGFRRTAPTLATSGWSPDTSRMEPPGSYGSSTPRAPASPCSSPLPPVGRRDRCRQTYRLSIRCRVLKEMSVSC